MRRKITFVTRCVSFYLVLGMLVLTVPIALGEGQGDLDPEVYPQVRSDIPGLEKAPSFPAETNFSIVLLPDTQIYSQSYPGVFDNQTEWIVDHIQQWNIKYMVHEGDITNNNNPPQWDNANKSIRTLDGEIPYILAMGNHDTGTNGNAATRDTAYFNQYFPYYEFENLSTFGGYYEAGKTENTYHKFTAGGEKWLIFATEFAPRDDVLRWANEVAENHTDHLILMSTHSYTAPSGGRMPSENYGVYDQPGGANSGQSMWSKFVRKHETFISVYSGHVWGSGSWRQTATGDNGNRVFEMLANYQDQPNGGNGWLRILTFDTLAQTIRVQTYSPYLDEWKSENKHNFTLDYERWWYFNDGPQVVNDLPTIQMAEDDRPGYLDLDGYSEPVNGVFMDPNQADGDVLTFAVKSGSFWCEHDDTCFFDSVNMTARVQANRTLEIAPKPNMYGTDTITLNATDSKGAWVTDELTISMTPVNDAPFINGTKGWTYQTPKPTVTTDHIIFTEDRVADLMVTAYDPIEPEDDPKLTFASDAGADNAPFFDIDPGTGHVTFTPTNDDVGSYELNITVDDGGAVNSTTVYTFTFEVQNVNDDPVITTTDVTEALEDEWYHVDYEATDMDPTEDDLTWVMFTDAGFLFLDPETGVLSGGPTNIDRGVYPVTINVTDGNGGHDEITFDLTVVNTNDPPEVLDPLTDVSFDEDTIDGSIYLSDWFTDMDGDVLTYQVQGAGHLDVMIDAFGNVTLEPEADWSGKETLTFIATDGQIEISSDVEVTVSPVNDPPTNARITLEDREYLEDGPQPANASAEDVDLDYGDEIHFIWTSNRSGLIGAGRSIDLSLSAGNHTLTLEVKDREGGSTTAQVELAIVPKNVTPPPPPPPPPPPDDDEEPGFFASTTFYGLLGAIIAIVVIVVIVSLMGSKGPKGGPEEMTENIMDQEGTDQGRPDDGPSMGPGDEGPPPERPEGPGPQGEDPPEPEPPVQTPPPQP